MKVNGSDLALVLALKGVPVKELEAIYYPTIDECIGYIEFGTAFKGDGIFTAPATEDDLKRIRNASPYLKVMGNVKERRKDVAGI